jgi:hypothetical protein
MLGFVALVLTLALINRAPEVIDSSPIVQQRHVVKDWTRGDRGWPAFRKQRVFEVRKTKPETSNQQSRGNAGSWSYRGSEREKFESLIRDSFATMSDREIIELLSEHTAFKEEELEEVRDLRGFIERLSSVWFTPPEPEVAEVQEFEEAQVVAVEFSRRVDLENRPRSDWAHFDSAARKIYATFPTDGRAESEVMVVWRDLGRSEVLAFARYPIESSKATNFVWLKQPKAWSPGTYSVEIFTADAAMEPLAKGTYQVAKK